MPVKPPTDAEVELLLCEDVREEAHGKFTLAGFYPGNSINVPQFGPSSPAFQIVFFFLIHSKEEGDYDATFHVVLPSGRPRCGASHKISNLYPAGDRDLESRPVFGWRVLCQTIRSDERYVPALDTLIEPARLSGFIAGPALRHHAAATKSGMGAHEFVQGAAHMDHDLVP